MNLIGYFAGGPQEKFYQMFTAMMNKVANVFAEDFLQVVIVLHTSNSFHYFAVIS